MRARQLVALAVGASLVWGAGVARAEMYKRVDEFGNVTYTNLPPPGAVPAPAPAPAPSTKPVLQPHPGEGRVTVDEQRSRDSESRRILTDELKKEADGLAQAESRHDADEVVRRKDNIAALQREIGRLK